MGFPGPKGNDVSAFINFFKKYVTDIYCKHKPIKTSNIKKEMYDRSPLISIRKFRDGSDSFPFQNMKKATQIK